MTALRGAGGAWVVVLLAACSSATGSHSATPSARGTAGASPTAQEVGSVRTVLSPLGLNIHSDPSRSAQVVGVAAQGTLLTVLDRRSDGGGWYKVQGQTVTGWIVADPTLTAAGQFVPYQSSRGFSALYPADWTFAEEASDTLFRPQQGSQGSIVVRTAATTSDFGPVMSGYVATFSDDMVVVCGYTGKLTEYTRSAGSSVQPSPNGSSAPALQRYAEIRLRFDASHAMLLAFNYASDAELTVFEDFYNAITFAYPQCQAPASAAPSPT